MTAAPTRAGEPEMQQLRGNRFAEAPEKLSMKVRFAVVLSKTEEVSSKDIADGTELVVSAAMSRICCAQRRSQGSWLFQSEEGRSHEL
jgi:hypothetical protein